MCEHDRLLGRSDAVPGSSPSAARSARVSLLSGLMLVALTALAALVPSRASAANAAAAAIASAATFSSSSLVDAAVTAVDAPADSLNITNVHCGLHSLMTLSCEVRIAFGENFVPAGSEATVSLCWTPASNADADGSVTSGTEAACLENVTLTSANPPAVTRVKVYLNS